MAHMKLSAFILLILSLSQADAQKSEFVEKILHRQKRAWVVGNFVFEENPTGSDFKPTPDDNTKVQSDNPGVQKYELRPKSPDFELRTSRNPDTNEVYAVLWQMTPLDYEITTKVELKAVALGQDGIQLENEPLDVTVIVTDLNDNKPVFEQRSLIGNIEEASIPNTGKKFMTIIATDKDKNDKMHYFYSGNESPPSSTARFAVSEDTGDVTLLQNLNKDTASIITFEVRVVDQEATRPGWPVTATVTVNVLDSNNHAPVFIDDPYSAMVGELTPVQSVIKTISASDADEGINREVHFEIIAGDPKHMFSVKSFPWAHKDSTAEIVLEQLLDFETPPQTYTLTIQAWNNNSINRQDVMYKSTAVVTITVTDENEAPVFQKSHYKAKVTENEKPGTPVLQVHAEDPDAGDSVKSYTLLNGLNWFDINSKNGNITTLQPIDRENELLVNQQTSIFVLKVEARDNGTPQKSVNTVVDVVIGDVNDNKPELTPLNVVYCQDQKSKAVANITITDKDTDENGPPFQSQSLNNNWPVELMGKYTLLLMTTHDTGFLKAGNPDIIVEIEVTDIGGQVGTSSVTVSICNCDVNGVCSDVALRTGGFAWPILIAIIAAILILLIIVLAVVAYRRRQTADLEKQGLFMDEDDVRENLQAYHDEGGGEEDNDHYDISALQAPPLIKPKRVDEAPQGSAQPQPRSRIPPDTDIGDYITDAKGAADNDPTAPPFDSLLVFDYEGQGSDAGSLSSLNSGTTDGSQDYQYLNNWGPRFQKLADMYGGGEDE